MTESEYDSEVMQLIDDLALVRIGTPEYRSWLAAWTISNYTRLWFCERWKQEMLERNRKRTNLCNELYKRNKPRSNYVYESFSYQSEIRW